MKRWTFVGGLVAIAAIVTTSAEDFPLTFKTIPARDVMAFPGGYGTYGQLGLTKPARLKQEPKAVSRHPLYGECRDAVASGGGFLFRLDESKGDGTGYDQLIVDLNRNGDLTDDAAGQRVVLPTEDTSASPSMQRLLFGPVEAPADEAIAGGRPIYFAQVYVYTTALRANPAARNVFAGQLRLKAGWYLETTVELAGSKHRVGVYDGDSNLRLGDLSKPRTFRDPREGQTWSFGPGDSWLVDVSDSGAFEPEAFQGQAAPLGPVVYLGATPYQVALAPDCRSLSVQPWKEPLAEVALRPRGDQVRHVTLAWRGPGDQWQLLRAGVAEGKIHVPPGSYRLYGCTVWGQAAPGDQVMAAAFQRLVKKPFNFAAGKANTLNCGAPLEIQVTAEKRRPGAADFRFGSFLERSRDAEFVLSINAKVVGADGEIYSSYAKGEKFKGQPPKPAFTVVDAGGKTVGNGNLEFG